MNRSPFATLKYQPYENRTEHVNIGIIVWQNAKVRIHLISNLRKIKAIYPQANLERIRDWEYELPALLDSFGLQGIEDQYEFINQFGEFKLSEANGLISYFDENQYQEKVALMLHSIATPKGSPFTSRNTPSSRLGVDLKKAFNAYGWLGKSQKDIEKHLIVPRYELSLAEAITADFALKNGVLNIIETIDMRTELTTAKKSEVRSKALVYDFAKQLDANQSKGYSIIAGGLYEEKAKPFVKLLERYSDQVLHWENAEDMSFFMSNMAKATGQPMLDIPIH